MTPTQWIESIRALGLPAVFTMTLLWIIWRTLKGVAPVFQGAYEKHVELVDDLKCSVNKQTELLTVIHEETQGTSRAMYHAAHALDEIPPKSRRESVQQHTARMQDEILNRP